MGDTLEQAQKRTAEFLVLLREEMTKMNLGDADEKFIPVAERLAPLLTDPNDHYQLREQLAGCFSSAAYTYLMKKFHVTAAAETQADVPVSS